MAALLSIADIRLRLFEAYCAAAGLDVSVLGQPGISIAGERDRSGSGVVSAYELDRHLVLRCDPAVVEWCRRYVTPDLDPTVAGFESALPDEADRLGRGFVHVLADVDSDPDPHVRGLVKTDDADVALISALTEADPEGAEDAEIELDALDAHAVGIEVDGALAAFASERPWDTDPSFADIGVLTHPDHRKRGLAAAAVRELSRGVLAAGRFPLYRCNATNIASKSLAEGVGFVEVVRLSAAIPSPPSVTPSEPHS
ncbi:MAG: GNAT family N-acetyltransferase [Acidimicrobiales bacterium]